MGAIRTDLSVTAEVFTGNEDRKIQNQVCQPLEVLVQKTYEIKGA
jgi:hypothetical protein